jgi:hypothetical protein
MLFQGAKPSSPGVPGGISRTATPGQVLQRSSGRNNSTAAELRAVRAALNKARAGCKKRIIGPKRIESRLVQLSEVARRGTSQKSRREAWARRMASMASLILAVLILFLLVTLSPVCAAIATIIANRSDPPRTFGPI